MLRGPFSTLFYGMYGPTINLMAEKATRTIQYYYENYRRNKNAQYHQTLIRNTQETTVRYRPKS